VRPFLPPPDAVEVIRLVLLFALAIITMRRIKRAVKDFVLWLGKLQGLGGKVENLIQKVSRDKKRS
jgi:hypothetical protein